MPPEREEDGEPALTHSRSSLSRVRADPRLETQRQEGEGSGVLVSLEAPGSRRGWPEQEVRAHRSLLVAWACRRTDMSA